MILYDWLGVVAIITFVVCSGLLYETLTRRRQRLKNDQPEATPTAGPWRRLAMDAGDGVERVKR